MTGSMDKGWNLEEGTEPMRATAQQLRDKVGWNNNNAVGRVENLPLKYKILRDFIYCCVQIC